MIRSMTAFAGSESETDGYRLAWEIRSVNHRYLDINMRLPENLRALETGLRAIITDRLKRGKIDCFLNFQYTDGSLNDLQIDGRRLAALIRAMREIESELHDTAPSSTLSVLQWPGITVEQKIDPQRLKNPIEDLLQIALSQVIACREREGARLSEIITERCRRLDEQVQIVRMRLPAVAEKLRSRLNSKLEEISAEVDPTRFEQEIVILLQKMDVDEEMERLSTHIAEVERVISEEEVAGRRLDFMFQEMNREANTLGSKSLDNETSRACVEMKVLIEQMREQVQNIE